MTDRVLCIAAHPDDEALGCGGTLAKHYAAGDMVTILFMADGVSSRALDMFEIRAREESARKAHAQGHCIFLRMLDNQMDGEGILRIAKKIEDALAVVQPTLIYTHHAGDLNIDHRLTHQAVMTACRALPGSTVKRILCFEVLSSTEWGFSPFQPAWFETVDPFRKMAMVEHYAGEMRDPPHARSRQSVLALMDLRGAQAGVPAAEAFVLARQIA